MVTKMLKSLKRIIAIGLFWLAGCASTPQSSDTLLAVSEFSHPGTIDTKFRYSYSMKGGNEQSQVEVLAGKGSKKKNLRTGLYFDVKSDLEEKIWAGARGEVDYKVGNTHFRVQLRHFSGLNENSADHFYFFPYILQDLTDKLSVGVWDYVKQNYEDGKGFSYVGPFTVYSPNKNTRAILHYGQDLREGGDLIYFKINFRF
jgi:hypothetical protein